MAFTYSFIAASLAIYLARYALRTLRQHMLAIETGVVDQELLGLGRPFEEKIKGTAVICGGSIAGLLAARVCRDHFEKVIVIEAEPWVATESAWSTRSWTQDKKRTRVMQYNAYQGLYVVNTMALNKLFPEFEAECEAADVRLVAGDFKTFAGGKSMPAPHDQYTSRGGLPKTIAASRRGYETLLRRLCIGRADYPEISLLPGTVTGITAHPGTPSRLQSVQARTSEGLRDIDAALVVDCTGQGRTGLKWLERAGCGYSASRTKDQLPLDQLMATFDPKVRYVTLDFSVKNHKSLQDRLPIPGDYAATGPIFGCAPALKKECRGIGATRVEGDAIQLCMIVWGDGGGIRGRRSKSSS